MANKTIHAAACGILTVAAIALTPLLATPQAAAADTKAPALGAPTGQANGQAVQNASPGYRYPTTPGYNYSYMPGYSYSYMPAYNYQTGTMVWVPVMTRSPMANGQAVPAPAPNNANAKPGAKGPGRPQPILCMVASKVQSPTMPSMIAVIANSEADCAAIGGSATQTAARK